MNLYEIHENLSRSSYKTSDGDVYSDHLGVLYQYWNRLWEDKLKTIYRNEKVHIDSKQSSGHFTKLHVSFVEIIWIIVSYYGDGALIIPVLEKDMPVVRIKCFIISLGRNPRNMTHLGR